MSIKKEHLCITPYDIHNNNYIKLNENKDTEFMYRMYYDKNYEEMIFVKIRIDNSEIVDKIPVFGKYSDKNIIGITGSMFIEKQGIDGQRGEQGPKGMDGQRGPKGIDGQRGQRGLQGPTGNNG